MEKFFYIKSYNLTAINVTLALMLPIHKVFLYPLAGNKFVYGFLVVFFIVSFTLLMKAHRKGYFTMREFFVSFIYVSLLITILSLAKPFLIQFLNFLCTDIPPIIRDHFTELLDLFGILSIIILGHNQAVPIGVEEKAINFFANTTGTGGAQETKSSHFAASGNAEDKAGDTAASPIIIDESSRESSPTASSSSSKDSGSGPTSKVGIHLDNPVDRLLAAVSPSRASVIEQAAAASDTAAVSTSTPTAVSSGTAITSASSSASAPSSSAITSASSSAFAPSSSNTAFASGTNTVTQGMTVNAGPSNNPALGTGVVTYPGVYVDTRYPLGTAQNANAIRQPPFIPDAFSAHRAIGVDGVTWHNIINRLEASMNTIRPYGPVTVQAILSNPNCTLSAFERNYIMHYLNIYQDYRNKPHLLLRNTTKKTYVLDEMRKYR